MMINGELFGTLTPARVDEALARYGGELRRESR